MGFLSLADLVPATRAAHSNRIDWMHTPDIVAYHTPGKSEVGQKNYSRNRVALRFSRPLIDKLRWRWHDPVDVAYDPDKRILRIQPVNVKDASQKHRPHWNLSVTSKKIGDDGPLNLWFPRIPELKLPEVASQVLCTGIKADGATLYCQIPE